MLNIIIVSHGHEDYIKKLLDYIEITKLDRMKFRFIIKDNKKSDVLKDLCDKADVLYCCSNMSMGFGANNNYAVNQLIKTFNVENSDYFLFLNPDILLSLDILEELYRVLREEGYDACTIDLFKDIELSQRDMFIRKFPSAKDFISSYLLGVNNTTINREFIQHPEAIDWCAGSFLIIRKDVFLSLNGFDECYFMYCEDLDICFRLKLSGYKLTYIPNLNAIHYAQHANRKILSKPFFWHLRSVFRYLYKGFIFGTNKAYLEKTKSLLKKHE